MEEMEKEWDDEEREEKRKKTSVLMSMCRSLDIYLEEEQKKQREEKRKNIFLVRPYARTETKRNHYGQWT